MAKEATDAVLQAFAERLFEVHPEFRRTSALYLDFEGSGSDERILSLYWPKKAGDDRFRMLWRGSEDGYALDSDGLELVLGEFDCDPESLRWVVVFSGGEPFPQEQSRFELQFGAGVFPLADWVNLHHVVRRCPQMSRSIKDHKNVWYTTDTSQVRKSLEALELEFGLQRPPAVRSRNNSYSDGYEGEMGILELEERLFRGRGTEQDADLLEEYCTWDVRSMYRIARRCEKLLQ